MRDVTDGPQLAGDRCLQSANSGSLPSVDGGGPAWALYYMLSGPLTNLTIDSNVGSSVQKLDNTIAL